MPCSDNAQFSVIVLSIINSLTGKQILHGLLVHSGACGSAKSAELAKHFTNLAYFAPRCFIFGTPTGATLQTISTSSTIRIVHPTVESF